MISPDKLLDLFRLRRSVRRFTDAPVDKAGLERVLEAARLAPSAHNRQPWRFVVVQGEARARLAEAMAARLRSDRLADGAAPEDVEADAARSRDRLTKAPAAILVCLTMEAMDRYPDARRAQAERLMAVQSVAMAGENLLLAAAAEGWGACWMCAPLFAGEEARRALDLPAAWEPQGLVLLGQAAEAPRPRGRINLEDVTAWR
ncbi:MAG TPA: nitroreductase family protein [Anaerolineales bacterium]|nr:nitroreductase family protein [Anaerolineales bacterium]